MQHLQLTASEIRKRSGFTLIELIVAISIMLLILGGGIAGYINLNDRETLIANGKELQQYMRAAQKRARAGDKPTGCNRLEGYSVTSSGGTPVTVELSAVCDNDTYLSDSYTFPQTLSLENPVNMQFAVLHGGVSNAGTVRLQSSMRNYTFTVDEGGQITEGVIEAN